MHQVFFFNLLSVFLLTSLSDEYKTFSELKTQGQTNISLHGFDRSALVLNATKLHTRQLT